MKKAIVVILLLLLINVWSVVFVGASIRHPLGVLPPSDKTLCSPAILPIGGYNLIIKADTTTTLMLEYFNLEQCFPMQMALTLLQPSQPTILHNTICAGESYTWHGNTYTKPGSYTDTLTNIYGCDSIVTLHLQVNPTYEVHDTVVACDSYLFNPFNTNGDIITIYQSGIYADTVTSISGCDSIFVLHLTINNSELGTTEHATICHGETYTWNGNTYNTSDTYTLTLSNEQGCDSTATLVLTVLPESVTQTENVVIGSDQLPYIWRGQSLNAIGQYTDIEQYVAAACDSVIHVLNLTVLATGVTDEQSDTICDTELPYQWYNQEYTATGRYTYTEQYAGTNIDSIQHILNLTVNYSDTAFFTATACDRYEWHEEEYNESGTYYYHTQTALGCDSVEVLRLTILPPTKYLTFDTLLCYGETCEWRNMPLTTAGTYNDTVKNQLECDSLIYTLNLEYLPNVQHFITDTAICFGFACTWRDETYTVSGTYHDTIRNTLDCDSIIYTLNFLIHPEIPITHVTDTMAGAEYYWNNDIYTTGGEYSVTLPAVTGCDSVVVLHLLTNHATIDTVILYEQCAGSGEQEIKIYTRGFIDSLAIHYSPKAKDAGWNDTVMSIATDNIYTIPYHDIRAGIYKVDLIALFHQEEVAHYNFHLTYLYPNTIFEQRYNDLIVLLTADYNGGYDFATFQWYKDGQPIWGETHSYLNQSLSFHSEYSVLLTDSTGLTLMSCPIIPENKAEYLVYPTIVNKGETITCATLEECELYLYDYSGNRIHQELTQKGETLISSPCVSGIYMLRMVMPDHTERTFRIIVL